LIIGTGAHGSLPIMPEVVAEAARRNIDLVGGDLRVVLSECLGPWSLKIAAAQADNEYGGV
jgi:hypothetical protein